MGYEISRNLFFRSRYPVEFVSPLGVLDHPHGVMNQVDLDFILTVGTRAGKISEQVGDDHALIVWCSDLGLQTRIACPIYEVVRIGTGPLLLQTGLQPRTGSNPALDSGCPTRIL